MYADSYTLAGELNGD